MKVDIYKVKESNSGRIVKSNRRIDVRRGRWIDDRNISHPMNYKRIKAFDKKRVYYLSKFGSGTTGVHISLTFIKNQRFLIMQDAHWLQQTENIKWVVTGLLSGGIGLALTIYKLYWA